MMTPSDKCILEAGLIAIAQLDMPLPTPVRARLAHIGRQLEAGEVAAIAQLKQEINRSDQLAPLYEQATHELHHAYRRRDRQANLLSHPAQYTGNEAEQRTLQTIAAHILVSVDAKAAAHRLMERSTALIQEQYPALQVFWDQLHQAIQGFDEMTQLALRELDRRPVTLHRLALILGQPVEIVQQLIYRLWERGYVVPAQTSFIQQSIPALRPEPTEHQLRPSVLFTLTSKGYFHLHPMVKRASAGRA